MSQATVAVETKKESLLERLQRTWIKEGRLHGKRRRLEGWIYKAVLYLLLIDMSFVFMFPFIYMVATSLKTVQDFVDPTVFWVPRTIAWGNYELAVKGLAYWTSMKYSAIIAIASAIAQVISCSIVGYGFARMKFRFRDALFALALFTFIVPPQTIIVPLFMVYKKLGWIDTYYPFVVPSLFANGLRGALFIFIFRQFFRGLPWELEDAAMVDGAGPMRVYAQIMLPLARPAIIVTFLFSLVWHWNDFFEPSIYLMSSEKFTLPLRLSMLWWELQSVFGSEVNELYNEPLVMAASMLVILPMLVVYIFAQRYFIEGIERTGVVG